MSNEYLLFICKDEDPNLDDTARLLFDTDAATFLKIAEIRGIGSTYRYEHHPFTNPVDALLTLKGMAFDELWVKNDIYVLYRTPDGNITPWRF